MTGMLGSANFCASIPTMNTDLHTEPLPCFDKGSVGLTAKQKLQTMRNVLQ